MYDGTIRSIGRHACVFNVWENEDEWEPSDYTGIIRGYAGSSAQVYAEKWGFRFEPFDSASEVTGDINGDNAVDSKDVVLLRRYIAGGWDVTLNKSAADLNGDGTINLKDVVKLRRAIAGGWDN